MDIQREYARKTDVGPEEQTQLSKGERLEREIANIKEWMKDVDSKVDVLIKDGCSHRGNDLSKLDRIERATDGIRVEATHMKDSVHNLALSFEGHKTKMVESSAITDNKITNLKIGILVQCALLLLALVGFLIKEFVITPHNAASNSGAVQYNSDKVVIDKESFQELVKDRVRNK